MKLLKQILVLLLCVCMSIPFGACGATGDTETAEETKGSVTTETEKATERETEKETVYAETLKNYFNPSKADVGWVNGKGETFADNSFRTSEMIEVSGDDVVEFGAAVSTQGWHLVLFDDNEKPIGDETLAKNLKMLDTINESTILITYTVPDHVAFVRLVADTRYENEYLITVNQPFTVADYIDYFKLSIDKPEQETFEVKKSVLNGKTALFLGDSICYGQWDDGRRLSWPGRIAAQYDMKAENPAIGGTCMSTIRGTGAQIVNQITPYIGRSFDYVIIEGGVNDAWGQVDGAKKVAPVGTVSESFDEKDFDIGTFAGGLEQLFSRVVNHWTNATIGYIFTFNMPGAVGIGKVTDMEEYWAVAIKICEKWDVEYLDMYHDEYVSNTLLEVTTNKYLRDPIHPNKAGYDRMSPFIAAWMEKL